MTENEKLKARLANTEKALCALATVISDCSPDKVQNDIDIIMCDYFDANTSLVFMPSSEFKSMEEEL